MLNFVPGAVFGEGDFAVAVEGADGFFVIFFGAVEDGGDFVGGGFVGEGEGVAVDELEDFVAEVVDAVAGAGDGEGEVDFAVFAHGFDVGCLLRLKLEGGIDFVVVYHAAVAVVDDGGVADVGVPGYEGVDALSLPVVGVDVAEEPFDACRGDDAVGLVVEIDVYQVYAAGVHAHLLLAEGAQQLFYHAPVEEGAVFVDVDGLEVGKLSHGGKGRLGGGYGPLLRVVVHKHSYLVAGADFVGHIFCRHKHFVGLSVGACGAIGKVKAEFGHS